MRVLVVDPDASTRSYLRLMLSAERMTVELVETAEDARDLLKVYAYDIVITELMLPDEAGLSLIRTLRMEGNNTPILVLTATGDRTDLVYAFGYGADEFMRKPYHKDELVARIHAVTRRERGLADPSVEIGNLIVHLGDRATVNGRPLALTGMQLTLLEELVRHRGQAMSRESLMLHLYGGRDEPDIKVLDIFMWHVRRKLKAAGWCGGRIETVWGRGWRLEAGDAPA